MDNQDKIFDKFKEAAENAPIKDFPGMEKVWSKVENKLDKKEDKKTITLWKKIAVAASLLLVISLGYQFLKTDKNSTLENTNKVVTSDTKKETNNNMSTEESTTIVSSDSQLVPKTEAIKILEKQTKNKESVAIQESSGNNAVNALLAPVAPPPSMAEASTTQSFEEEAEIAEKKEESLQKEYATKYKEESAKVAFAEKQAMSAKKSAPLIIMNGNAMAHSNDTKRDKMMQDQLPNVQPENVESLVILDEPLYIIDGIYYSENDLFGKNPTSPYAPLNQQDIKTITILQDLEATEKYGEKGKKGVVIITTKTGKPTPKK